MVTKYTQTLILNEHSASGKAKFNSLFKEALKKETPRIIIDRTNGNPLNRIYYQKMAREYNYKIYIILFNLSRDLIYYLNSYRTYTSKTSLIPQVAYSMFYKYKEGLDKEEIYDECWNYTPNLPSEIFIYSF